MKNVRIKVLGCICGLFSTHRNIVNVDESRFIDVAAIVLSIDDIEHGKLDEIDATVTVFPCLSRLMTRARTA